MRIPVKITNIGETGLNTCYCTLQTSLQLDSALTQW